MMSGGRPRTYDPADPVAVAAQEKKRQKQQQEASTAYYRRKNPEAKVYDKQNRQYAHQYTDQVIAGVAVGETSLVLRDKVKTSGLQSLVVPQNVEWVIRALRTYAKQNLRPVVGSQDYFLLHPETKKRLPEDFKVPASWNIVLFNVMDISEPAEGSDLRKWRPMRIPMYQRMYVPVDNMMLPDQPPDCEAMQGVHFDYFRCRICALAPQEFMKRCDYCGRRLHTYCCEGIPLDPDATKDFHCCKAHTPEARARQATPDLDDVESTGTVDEIFDLKMRQLANLVGDLTDIQVVGDEVKSLIDAKYREVKQAWDAITEMPADTKLLRFYSTFEQLFGKNGDFDGRAGNESVVECVFTANFDLKFRQLAALVGDLAEDPVGELEAHIDAKFEEVEVSWNAVVGWPVDDKLDHFYTTFVRLFGKKGDFDGHLVSYIDSFDCTREVHATQNECPALSYPEFFNSTREVHAAQEKGSPGDYFCQFYDGCNEILNLNIDAPVLKPMVRKLVMLFECWEGHYHSQRYQEIKRAFGKVQDSCGIAGAPFDPLQIILSMREVSVPLAALVAD